MHRYFAAILVDWGLRDYGVDGQLGLEQTIEEYVAKMVEVGQALRRVLRPDGVMFWNHGDCYVDKQLQGQPWRVALALQADGWWLRSDIIWHKENPMPESVQGSHFVRHRVTIENMLVDCPGCPKCSQHGEYILQLSAGRPTKSHEYVFLLTKSAKYFWDQDAVRETAVSLDRPQPTAEMKSIRPNDTSWHDNRYAVGASGYGVSAAGRNIRSVWTIATHAFSDAHFATFPPKLVETCIKAGTSAKGCCPTCGAPWVRITETEQIILSATGGPLGTTPDGMGRYTAGPRTRRHDHTLRWQPTCACLPAEPVSCTVLDPFAGSGTTLLVADRLQRNAIGIDLNTKYAEMAVSRIKKDQGGLFADVDMF